jgi:uncharacterized LabA/DUF88 family protein
MPKDRIVVYAFIDSQNLNLGTKNDIFVGNTKIYSGWKLDYEKFFQYLSDKFHVTKAFIFIGYVKKYESLYKSLKSYGYELVYKPTVIDDHGKPKGNIDAELVLYSSAIEFEKYDKAVFVAGDGDYYCLYNFLNDKGKLYKIIIPNKKTESSLLKKFQSYKVFLEFEREKLEFNNGR